ncbi:MAG: pantetheine-phosphate adenylyltransferase [Chlamydiales bacterium]|nr:pantetheine-phosphate adenylyltransferase [Chlamydiales bacterium]
MNKALVSGTFDPPTLGHLDIIERAAKLTPQLIVGVAANSEKNTLFSLDERLEMLRQTTSHLNNVSVVQIDGLVADFVQKQGIDCIVRGLRSCSDENEFRMALANRQMSGVETLFLVASPQLTHLSSSLIREIAASGHHLEAFVPSSLIHCIYQKISK